MQFGLVLHSSGQKADWSSFASFAKEAEALGYDSVWVTDHLMSPSGAPRALEAWTILSALSQLTNRIRLGTYVLCNQFRHPSILARMASTLDNVSKGRLELGIGAGWFVREHMAFGLNWYPHSIRVERLSESLEVAKRLWTEDNVTYDGVCFHLRNATLDPKSTQKSHPPIWIGGRSPAILKTMAQWGNGWIPVLPSPKQLHEGISCIRREMIKTWREHEKLQVAYGGSRCLIVANDQREVEHISRSLFDSSNQQEDVSRCVVGNPHQCVAKIEGYRRAGANAIVAGFYDFPSMKGLKLFAETVIPHFKTS